MSSADTSRDRENVFKILSDDFEDRVFCAIQESASADKLSREQLLQVQQRFKTTFNTFLERGFHILFSGGSCEETEASDVVGEEELENLDKAIEKVAEMRRLRPAAALKFVEKTMEHKTAATSLVRVAAGIHSKEFEAQLASLTNDDGVKGLQQMLTTANPQEIIGSDEEALLVKADQLLKKIENIQKAAKCL